MSPETFTSHVRQYCEWAESNSHDMDTAHRLLRALVHGAPGLSTSCGDTLSPERTFPGLAQEVPWVETRRFADFPFQVYPVVFWPYGMHPEGPFTDNLHDDFAHIYAELRHGLQAMEQGNITQALQYWRDSY